MNVNCDFGCSTSGRTSTGSAFSGTSTASETWGNSNSQKVICNLTLNISDYSNP